MQPGRENRVSRRWGEVAVVGGPAALCCPRSPRPVTPRRGSRMGRCGAVASAWPTAAQPLATPTLCGCVPRRDTSAIRQSHPRLASRSPVLPPAAEARRCPRPGVRRV